MAVVADAVRLLELVKPRLWSEREEGAEAKEVGEGKEEFWRDVGRRECFKLEDSDICRFLGRRGGAFGEKRQTREWHD